MKRLISFVLCAAMLVSMVVFTSSAAYATSPNWGLNAYTSGGVVPNTDHYAGYGDVGYQFTGDGQKSTQMAILQNGNNPTNLDFTFYTGLYITSTYSVWNRSVWCVGSSNGASAYYDFNRDKFVIQWTDSNGWECDYDDAGANKVELDYDLPLNQWFNIGIRMSNSVIAIYLNGEKILSVDGHGYAAGDAVLCWPIGINGYMDNLQMFDGSGAKLIGATNYHANLDISSGATTNSYLYIPYKAGMTLYNTTIPVGIGYCGAQWAMDLIQTAYDHGTGVTEAQLTAANNAWAALSPAQKYEIGLSEDKLTGGGYNHLLAKANGYYYAVNSAEVANAKNLINAIGTVTYTDVSKAKIDAARAAYNTAISYNWDSDYNAHFTTGWDTDAINAVIGSYATLEAAEARYAELEKTQGEAAQNQAAANAVIEKINTIGAVTYTDVSKAKIDAARNAYDALTPAQKTLVTNLSTLTAAEKTYADLKAAADKEAADQAAANAVIGKINAIGAVTYTDASKTKIDAARNAYDALTPAQKALVTNSSTLTAAEKTYADLKAAADKEAADREAANVVITMIDAIGTVNISSGDKIAAAEAAYADLSDEAKAYVTNYSTLQAARTAYNTARVNDFYTRAIAEATDTTIGNKANIESLLEESKSLSAYVSPTNPTLYQKYNTANVRLNNALAAIEAFEAKVAVASELNRVRATSLTISDSLAINYKVEVAEGYDIVGVEFLLDGETTLLTEYTVEESTGRLMFRFDNISPDLMGETITSRVVLGGAELGYNSDYYCEARTYSIATYASNMIGYESVTELLASMINYGDAAVAYTGAHTAPSTLVANWSDYTDNIVAVRGYTSIQKIGTEIANPAVTWGSASLILSDSVDIKIKLNGDISEGSVVKTFYGKEFTFDVITENGESYFVWDIYNAAQMGNNCAATFTVYDANGNTVSNSIKYSVESYVADTLASVDNAKLADLLTAMMQYGDAALDYKNAALVNG